MEEGFQREVSALRNPAKVSFWEVEEEKTREVVDEIMKPGASSQSEQRSSSQRYMSGLQSYGAEGLMTHQDLALAHTALALQEEVYQAERTGDGGTKSKRGGLNLGGDASS